MNIQKEEVLEKPVAEILYGRQSSSEIQLSPVHLSLENSPSDSSEEEEETCAKVVEYTLKNNVVLQDVSNPLRHPVKTDYEVTPPYTKTPPSSRRCSSRITEKNPNFQNELQDKLQKMLKNQNTTGLAVSRNTNNEKYEQIAINIDPIITKPTPKNAQSSEPMNNKDQMVQKLRQMNDALKQKKTEPSSEQMNNNDPIIGKLNQTNNNQITQPSKQINDLQMMKSQRKINSSETSSEPMSNNDQMVQKLRQMNDALKQKLTEPSSEQMNINDPMIGKVKQTNNDQITQPSKQMNDLQMIESQRKIKSSETSSEPMNNNDQMVRKLRQMNDALKQKVEPSSEQMNNNDPMIGKLKQTNNDQITQPSKQMNDLQMIESKRNIKSAKLIALQKQLNGNLDLLHNEVIKASKTKQINDQDVVNKQVSKQEINITTSSESMDNDSDYSKMSETVSVGPKLTSNYLISVEERMGLEKKEFGDDEIWREIVDKEVVSENRSLEEEKSSTGHIKALNIPKTEIPLEHDVTRVGGPKTETATNMASLRPKSPAPRPIITKNEKDESIWDKLGTLGRKKRMKEVQEVQAEGKYAIDSPGLPAAPVIPPEEYNLDDNEERCIIDPKAWEDPKFQELMNVLKEWINDELASQRIIVQDLTEDLYDGQVLQKLLEKLTGDKLDVPEVTQSEEGQKQKLAVVLAHFNQVLGVQRLGHNKWSVETIHSKNIVAIIHLLVSLARHFRPPVRLTENVSVDVVVVRKQSGQLQHKIVRESLTKSYDDVGMRCERDAFDTLFDHAPDKLQVVKKSLVTFVNKHLNKMNFEVSEIETQFHDGVYLIMLMGLLEGFFVPHYVFHLTPHEFEQKVHNVSFAFELMEEVGLQKPKARPEDVVNMDLKSTLRVLYNLFLRYKTII